MKKLSLLACLFMPLTLLAQGSYHLKGVFKGISDSATLQVVITHSTIPPKNATLKDGVFIATGTVDAPTEALLMLERPGKPAEFKPFYLHEGNITVESDGGLSTAKIIGSDINRDFEIYRKFMADSYPMDPEEMTKAFINKYPQSYFTIIALNELAGSNSGKVKALESIYNKLDGDIKKTAAAATFREWAKKAHGLGTGNPAPSIEAKDANGKVVKLSDYKGSYVLVHFWASWCPGCRDESPSFLATYSQYKDKGLKVLYVSIDAPEKRDAWLKAIKDDGVGEFNNVNNQDVKLLASYNIRAIPLNVLVGPDGKIVASDTGVEAVNKAIAANLK